jgi:hypothetical protein
MDGKNLYIDYTMYKHVHESCFAKEKKSACMNHSAGSMHIPFILYGSEISCNAVQVNKFSSAAEAQGASAA